MHLTELFTAMIKWIPIFKFYKKFKVKKLLILVISKLGNQWNYEIFVVYVRLGKKMKQNLINVGYRVYYERYIIISWADRIIITQLQDVTAVGTGHSNWTTVSWSLIGRTWDRFQFKRFLWFSVLVAKPVVIKLFSSVTV